MPISPWHEGQLAPLWSISLITDAGPDNINGITSGACAISFLNVATGVKTSGVGSFAIVQNYPAIVSYQLASADVATTGTYSVTLTIQFSNGPKSYDLGQWVILP